MRIDKDRPGLFSLSCHFVSLLVILSVGHNRYISIIELIEIIALYNRMIIRIVRL
jgi:hypothetical protein